MIQVNQIKLPVSHTEEELLCAISHTLRIDKKMIRAWHILRRSVDARKKPDLYYVYSVLIETAREQKLVSVLHNKNIRLYDKVRYQFPEPGESFLRHRPVIVGSGPAGLFCACLLADHGYAPIIIERGERADIRKQKVETFWKKGVLDPDCNVQFGEGGAGTFSDGKLNTMVKDREGRHRRVLELFVECGAPASILYEQKPHLGTDQLICILEQMRKRIIDKQGTFYFSTRLDGILYENQQYQLTFSTGMKLVTQQLVLAIGHSARDTMRMLYDFGITMTSKAFAVGLRIEHPQAMINQSQYSLSQSPVGAAPYKVTHQTQTHRGVYSFCMCPGGYVVNASSEPGGLAINGMSYQDRDGQNANSALIVTVNPSDFERFHFDTTPEALRGIEFQRMLEQKAYAMGEGRIPVQLYQDFVENRCSCALGDVEPCMKGDWTFGNLNEVLPFFLTDVIREGMTFFGRMIKGFDRPDALFSGVESRTSSPVRMQRDETLQSSYPNIYPCGEGAGYAGGITSAAIDGMRVAEEIARKCEKIL